MSKNNPPKNQAAAPAPAPAPKTEAEAEIVKSTEETRPEGAEPGVQIDGQGLPPAPGDLVPYAVRWNIKLDGKRYAEGDTVNTTPDKAAPFLASGAIAAKD